MSMSPEHPPLYPSTDRRPDPFVGPNRPPREFEYDFPTWPPPAPDLDWLEELVGDAYESRIGVDEEDDEDDEAPAGDVRFLQVLDELEDMHNRKQADYGREKDPYANVRASVDFGIPPWVGALVRGNDKMRRLQTAANQLIETGTISLSNEGVRDSLVDGAVYFIIAVVLYDEANSE